jgi:amino acid transporter
VPSAPTSRAAVKRTFIGRPRATGEMEGTLLSKTLALPVFASDPLSSVAYATESGLVVLIAASAAAAYAIWPVSIAIAVLMAIVVLSYRQTVMAYETSGGAYVVAKENLGTMPSLVAAAALLVDYVLTVAVSVAAGVLALTSAVPSLDTHDVGLSLFFVALLTVVNLRGVRESGIAFALPTYAFVAAMFALIATGLWKCTTGICPQATVPDPLAAGTGALTLFVVVRAFAGGAAALTGVEAISNGVSAFREPKGRNASTTLAVLGVIAIALLLGVSYLAVAVDAMPSSTVSLVSEIARAVFPTGSAASPMYYVVQGLTFAILVLAANTSYQGFPRLAAVLARDRFFPRQFVNLGDRLVYSNGIIVLAAAASLLIWIFNADVIALIHLYVIGVFTAFTLSQAGMVRYWLRRKEPRWRRRVAVNGVGAATTGLVTLLVIQAKFTEGAWMVAIAIPLLIGAFLAIHRHYRVVARRLRAGTSAVRAAGEATNSVVLYVESLDPATSRAAWYAKLVANGGYRPVHVRSSKGPDPRGGWWDFSGGPRIETLEPVESSADALLDFVWGLPRGESNFVTVVLPELFTQPSIVAAVRKRTTFALKLRLLSEPGVVICDVPVTLGAEDGEPTGPSRAAVRVLVSGAHAATQRAVNYAGSLGLPDTRAVFFAFDAAEGAALRREWSHAEIELPLEIVEAPFRDLGDPLREYLRTITADPEVVASVIMPELVFSGARKLLHNQRALYIKRLLLFEPRVILSSVPYHLP